MKPSVNVMDIDHIKVRDLYNNKNKLKYEERTKTERETL